MDASRVYVRALALGCFYSHISTRTFRRALTASVDSCAEIKSAPKLQALVYDILPLTTAVFSYAIGSRKLSANEQFFVGAETSKFITNKSDYIRHLFYN